MQNTRKSIKHSPHQITQTISGVSSKDYYGIHSINLTQVHHLPPFKILYRVWGMVKILKRIWHKKLAYIARLAPQRELTSPHSLAAWLGSTNCPAPSCGQRVNNCRVNGRKYWNSNSVPRARIYRRSSSHLMKWSESLSCSQLPKKYGKFWEICTNSLMCCPLETQNGAKLKFAVCWACSHLSLASSFWKYSIYYKISQKSYAYWIFKEMSGKKLGWKGLLGALVMSQD